MNYLTLKPNKLIQLTAKSVAPFAKKNAKAPPLLSAADEGVVLQIKLTHRVKY